MENENDSLVNRPINEQKSKWYTQKIYFPFTFGMFFHGSSHVYLLIKSACLGVGALLGKYVDDRNLFQAFVVFRISCYETSFASILDSFMDTHDMRPHKILFNKTFTTSIAAEKDFWYSVA